MIGKTIKTLAGVILVPVVIAMTVSFFQALGGVTDGGNPVARIFFIGCLTYMMLHIFLFRPLYIYTLGHEAMHAVATWVSGGKVKDFRVGSGEGSVKTTKSNTFISLAPYFIPAWTLVVSIIYFVLPLFIQISNLRTIYFFLAGFTLFMHFVLTSEALRQDQPDLVDTGYIFSIALIYIINMALLSIVVSLLFEEVGFLKLMKDAYIIAKAIYIKIFTQLFML